MNHIPIGLELYTLRKEFAQSAEEALRETAKMGYDGVEFSIDHQHLYTAEYLKKLLADNNLHCFGYLVMWEDMQKDTIQRTLDYNAALGNRSVAIGSAPAHLLKTEDGLKQVIDELHRIHMTCKAQNFTAGYHNHDIEFSVKHHGQTVWDIIFGAMPADFPLVFDTGNAMDGGGDPIAVVNKYPGRMQIVHAKPYSNTTEYATMIGQDDIDWVKFLQLCIQKGKTDVIIVEYGNSILFPPYESSRLCLQNLRSILKTFPSE